MDWFSESLCRSPELFPHALDVGNDRVSFIRLSRTEYEQASFLDTRILTARTVGQAIPWTQVTAAIEAARLTERCGFIFHTGHVGSTLVSRLIGAHAGAFGLREPMILRVLAQLHAEPQAQPRSWSEGGLEARLAGCLKLWSRTYDSRQLAVVKATSFVSELSADLLTRAGHPRALLMYVSPESYLATILGGPNSRQEAQLLTPGRLRRLHRRVGRDAWRLESLSEGEAVALGWACEMSALAVAQQAAGERAMGLDFDQFLLRPRALLSDALRHFEIDATPGEVDAIIAGPDMRRYSKSPEHAYDAALRVEVLNEARATHSAEIRRGLAWLERALEFAAIREALKLAEIARPAALR
jgi:hypothetical protein